MTRLRMRAKQEPRQEQLCGPVVAGSIRRQMKALSLDMNWMEQVIGRHLAHPLFLTRSEAFRVEAAIREREKS